MISAFSTGFLLGLSLIVAIGAQNAFVLRQGLLRKYVFHIAFFCAISDALLGAAGLRDIGYYFPDSDPKNKNLSSLIIIERSLDLLKDNGLWPRNIDFVVVCENPKIGPYVNQIKKSLSAILKIEESFIGVKATTTEKMGVIGNGNGIAVYAIASLRNK